MTKCGQWVAIRTASGAAIQGARTKVSFRPRRTVRVVRGITNWMTAFISRFGLDGQPTRKGGSLQLVGKRAEALLGCTIWERVSVPGAGSGFCLAFQMHGLRCPGSNTCGYPG